MKKILTASLFSIAALGPASADSADEIVQGTDAILSALLYSDIVLQACELPPDQKQAITDNSDRSWPYLKGALEHRAQQLHPEIDETSRQETLLADLHRHLNDLGSTFDPKRDCDPFADRLIRGFDAIKTEDLRVIVQAYATGAVEFDHQRPVTTRPDALTYANPAQQERVLEMAAARLAPQGCDAPALSEVRLSRREAVEDAQIPIYEPTPVEYQEEWRFDCNGEVRPLAVGFSDDGEGRVGPISVTVAAP